MLTAKTTTAALARTRVSAVHAAKSISSVAARPLAISHPDSCYCLTCHKTGSTAFVSKRSFSTAHPPACGCPSCPRAASACTCCVCKTGSGKSCCTCLSCVAN